MKSIVAALRGAIFAIRNLEAKVLIGLLLLTLAGLSFAWLANQVMDGDTNAFDEWALSSLRVPEHPDQPIGPAWLEQVARDITAVGGVTFVALLIAAVTGYFLLQRNYGLMLVVLLSSGSGAVVAQLLKKIFDRPRPSHVVHLVDVHTSSFPSGHSMLSAIVFLTLGVLLARFAKTPSLKAYYLTVAVALTLLVGMSRAYLGVHYPTDILAGWAAGLAWALLCWLIARRLQKRHVIEAPGINK